MQRRVIVVPLIRNQRAEYLLCKMPAHRGVYPGQWGLPGGGVEDGEQLEEALRRETREELGIELTTITPLFFKDTIRDKLYPDGSRVRLHMVFLIYDCLVERADVRLNEEFTAFAWVVPAAFGTYDLNDATLDTLQRAGLLADRPPTSEG